MAALKHADNKGALQPLSALQCRPATLSGASSFTAQSRHWPANQHAAVRPVEPALRCDCEISAQANPQSADKTCFRCRCPNSCFRELGLCWTVTLSTLSIIRAWDIISTIAFVLLWQLTLGSEWILIMVLSVILPLMFVWILGPYLQRYSRETFDQHETIASNMAQIAWMYSSLRFHIIK